MSRHNDRFWYNGVVQLPGALENWWADPQITGIGRLPAHTTFRSFDSRDAARDGCGAHWIELDTDWRFRLLEHPSQAPTGWAVGPSTDDRWHSITVPGSWTMQPPGIDTGDLPHYTNIVMPFTGNPPSIPDRVMAGLHRRSVSRDELQSARAIGDSRRCILHLGGAESAAAVWWNGEFVGITSDSRLPSEFDVTEHLCDGPNELAIMVVRWSAHTWLEDQDHWFHAGLHRRVALRGSGRVGFDDVIAEATLHDDGTSGTVTVTSRVRNGAAHSVRARLETMTGRTCRGGTSTATVPMFDDSNQLAAMIDAYRHPGPVASVSLHTDGIRPWSSEDPQRYRLLVELIDAAGTTVEVVPLIVGFRSVEIRGSELLLNGYPLQIAGVNRHDHSPLNGKASTDAELRDEVMLIRRAGFNAVRTAHYPPDPAMLDACDEFGLWVICEANVESHARWRELVNDPRYQSAFIERVQRMVATHRNHPSIMAWSLGNESGYGAVHDAAAAWIRHTDPSRFVHYEGANSDYWRVGAPASDDRASDIECPMYPSVDALITWATTTSPTRPLIMCEYSHAMGNSNGDLDRYWDAIHRYPGLQGGFIWDWRDQGLIAPAITGHEHPVYGGAFGERPHDAAFCCNGISGAHGDLHPAIEEHRWLTRPIRTAIRQRDGVITMRVENRMTTLSTDSFRCRIAVQTEDSVIQRWSPAVSVPAGSTATVVLGAVDAPTDAEWTVTAQWESRHERPWADRGQIIAWDQALFGRRNARKPPADPNGGLPDGMIDAGQPTLWRPPTDNDGQRSGPLVDVMGPLTAWKRRGLDRLDAPDDNSCVWRTGDGTKIDVRRRQRLITNGMWFDERITLGDDLDDVARVGIIVRLDGRLDQLRYFGRGPWETATDRRGAPLGVWTNKVADEYVPYAVPQHHGTHIDTRWLELTDASGDGMRFTFGRPTSFNVSVFSPDVLSRAHTAADLASDGMIYLHLDAALRGVGTGACGPDTSVRVAPGSHRLTWMVTQVSRKRSRKRSTARRSSPLSSTR